MLIFEPFINFKQTEDYQNLKQIIFGLTVCQKIVFFNLAYMFLLVFWSREARKRSQTNTNKGEFQTKM